MTNLQGTKEFFTPQQTGGQYFYGRENNGVRPYLLVEEASFRWNFEHFSTFYGFSVLKIKNATFYFV